MQDQQEVPVRRRKDTGIESLRGIAIVLMVAGHVIGAGADQGLTVPDDSAWRFSYRALEDLRMPLFTVLSGYVYAYRPVRGPDGVGTLIAGKVRRLLVPFLVVGTVFFLVQMVAPGTNHRPEPGDLPNAYLYGYQHLWFLQAIFLVFLVVGLLDAYGRMRSFRAWGAVTLASCALYVLVRVPDGAAVFSINGALRLLPFFLLGYGAHRYATELLRPGVLIAAGVAFAPVYGLRLHTIAADASLHPMVLRSLSMTVAVLAVVTLLAVRRHLEARLLGWLGGFSFGIYLLHVFGSAGARILADHLGVESTPVLFALSLSAGLALPIAFEVLFGHLRVVSWAVLGQKPTRRGASRPPWDPGPRRGTPSAEVGTGLS